MSWGWARSGAALCIAVALLGSVTAAGREQQPVKKYSGAPMDLDLQGADLRMVLRTFAETNGLNIVIDSTVKGTVDIKLTAVPWDQALDIILKGAKLGYVVEGTVVRVAPLDVIVAEEKQRRELADEQALAGVLEVKTYALSYAQAAKLEPLVKYAALSSRGEIRVAAAYLRDRIGKNLSIDELRTPLERLGFGVAVAGDDLTVTVPEWRNTGDVSGPHDLIEEIARLHGYARFEFQAPLIRLEQSARNYARGAERRLKEYLAFSCGMQEVITYPWVEDRFVTAAGFSVEAAPLRLSAPPAPDQATLRTSLVPGLLSAIESNIRWRGSFRIFETGLVSVAGPRVSLDDPRETLPPQSKRVAAAFVGDDAEALFREAKGAVEAIAARVHVAPVRIVDHSASASGTAADDGAPWADSGALTAIVSEGHIIGHLGVLNRRGTKAAGLRHAFAAIFEFDITPGPRGLVSAPSRDNTYVASPELPAVEVDVSLTYPDAVTWASIAEAAGGVSPLIAAIEFVDQYRGKGIPDGHRSVTLRARLQPTSQTLTSEEAVAVADAIRATERQRFGARER